jgi:hypothetical protein
MFKVLLVVGGITFINYVNGFNLTIQTVITAVAVTLLIGIYLVEGTKYLLVGNQIEIRKRHDVDVLTIGKINELQVFSVAYGPAGLVSKDVRFINYNGKLIRINDGLKNDSGKSLSEILTTSFGIAIVKKNA